MKIMLVGGAVRDVLLGRAGADKDYLVLNTDRDAFFSRYPHAREVGVDFPIFLMDGCEYAFPRGGSLASDLLARDLTINALARDEDGEIHAHPRALDDLHSRILRPCSERTFIDDPLRVYRAARFSALFPDFSLAPELTEGMRTAARDGLLKTISAERVGMEIRKALSAPEPGRFLETLDRGACLAPWFREFEHAASIPAGPPRYHSRSVLGHTAEVMNRLAAQSASPLAVWGGLCHDLGKTLTPKDELPRHIGHEKRGTEPAEKLAARIKLPNRFAETGAAAAKLHLKAGRYPELRPGTRVDLLAELHARNLLEEIFRIALADGHGDHLEEAEADLAALLTVRLAKKDRNLGAKSGEILRALRAEAVAARSRRG